MGDVSKSVAAMLSAQLKVAADALHAMRTDKWRRGLREINRQRGEK